VVSRPRPPPNPPQLDQKTSESAAPTMPTTSRITPTASRFTPDTSALTAQSRMAPAAASKMLTLRPMCAVLSSFVGRHCGRARWFPAGTWGKRRRAVAGAAGPHGEPAAGAPLPPDDRHGPLRRQARVVVQVERRDVRLLRRNAHG